MSEITRCDCVVKLNALVKSQYDPEGYLKYEHEFNFKTGKTAPIFPPLFFRHREKNAKGHYTRKWKTSHFSANYCPMCGMKLVEESEKAA